MPKDSDRSLARIERADLLRLAALAADAEAELFRRNPQGSGRYCFPAGPPDKAGLARIVDADGGQDEAENSYYEEAADPGFVRIETAQRRFRGPYLRRLRCLADRDQFGGA